MQASNKLEVLVQFSKDFVSLKDKEYSELAAYLKKMAGKKYQITNFHIPTVAKRLRTDEKDLVKLIHSAYEKLVRKMNGFSPAIIATEHVEIKLCVSAPKEELQKLPADNQFNARGKDSMYSCNLAVIPRVGDVISLPFLSPNLGYQYGMVEDVTHIINPPYQVIYISVNAFKRSNIPLTDFLDPQAIARENILKKFVYGDEPFIKIEKGS